MPRLDNDFIEFSSLISESEIALHEYAYSPQRGLEKFQSALYSLQELTRLNPSDDTFRLRLTSLIDIVDELVLSGSPYSSHSHVAFMSATDALFQVAVGSQFGADRASQLVPLLSIECWAVLLTSVREEKKKIVPIYVDYNAYLKAKVLPVGIGEYLSSLDSIGRVSFHLQSSKGAYLDGYFALTSVQSIAWLKVRFPELQWEIATKKYDTNEPLRDLCEQSVLPLFQHMSMQRNFRNNLLNVFESTFTALFYQKFGDVFSHENINVQQVDRAIPMPRIESNFKGDNIESDNHLLTHFPVRHGGFFYSGVIDLRENRSNVLYKKRLGQDFLPSFLYEIDTHNGYFVFDQAECAGLYSIVLEDISDIDGEACFVLENGSRAHVLFNISAYHSIDELFSLSIEPLIEVLIVEQVGEYFALPYIAIKEVECVCTFMSQPRSWAKNIWLSKDNKPYLEPWLINVNRLPNGCSTLDENAPHRSIKNGYYFGKVFDKKFWIEAELFLDLAPYQAPCFLTHFTSDQQYPFIIYNGRCFDQVIVDDCIESPERIEKERHSFSAILEWMGEVVVLPFDSCQWNASLPEASYIKEFDVVSMLTTENIGKHFISSLCTETVVIDKTNFLSFVGGLWPSSLSLESDY